MGNALLAPSLADSMLAMPERREGDGGPKEGRDHLLGVDSDLSSPSGKNASFLVGSGEKGRAKNTH